MLRIALVLLPLVLEGLCGQQTSYEGGRDGGASPVNVQKQPVKYKGPLVYSGLPPPVIHFAGHVRQGVPVPKRSMEYVPLPYKDLPILIYRSREHPPIHVVNNPDNEVQSSSSDTPQANIESAPVSVRFYDAYREPVTSTSEFSPTYVRPSTSFLRNLWYGKYRSRGSFAQPSESIITRFRPRNFRPSSIFKQDHFFIEAPASPNPIYIPPPSASYYYGNSFGSNSPMGFSNYQSQPSSFNHFYQQPYQNQGSDYMFAGRPEASESYAQILTGYPDHSQGYGGGYSSHHNIANFDLQTSASDMSESQTSPSMAYADGSSSSSSHSSPSSGSFDPNENAYSEDQMSSESNGSPVHGAFGMGSPRLMGAYAFANAFGGRFGNSYGSGMPSQSSNVNYITPEALARMPYNGGMAPNGYTFANLNQDSSHVNYAYAEPNPSDNQNNYNENEQSYYQDEVSLEGLRSLTKALGLKKPMEFLTGYGNQASQSGDYALNSFLAQESQNVYEDFNPNDYHNKDEEGNTHNELTKNENKDEMSYKNTAPYPKINYKVPPTAATAAPKHFKPPIIIYQGIRPPVHVYSHPAVEPKKQQNGGQESGYVPSFSIDDKNHESDMMNHHKSESQDGKSHWMHRQFPKSYAEMHPIPDNSGKSELITRSDKTKS